MERWLVHPVYIDYEVSDHGRVRRATPGRNTAVGRLLHPHLNSDGYRVTRLRRKEQRIHVLVLETFVGQRPDGHWACHADDNKENNLLTNLRWAPYAENYSDWTRNGGGRHGTRCYAAKLTEPDVLEIRNVYSMGHTSYSELAKRYGVDRTAIAQAVTRQTWKHV